MDLLRLAVVDITTLVATRLAVRHALAAGAGPLRPRQLVRLRRELKRGAVAYVDTLARSKRRSLDEATLGRCRSAAEREMPRALRHREALVHILAHQAGALDGLAAARQDLWRLAHMAIQLKGGVAALEALADPIDRGDADRAGRLRQRLRRALEAYGRTLLRTKSLARMRIVEARGAALREIGRRSEADARRLAEAEARLDPAHDLLRLGVLRSLRDLALDWRPWHAPPTRRHRA